MTTYSTAQIDVVVGQLEAQIGAPWAKVRTAEGREIDYKTNADIRNGLAYWKGLYVTATDAPTPTPKIRTFLYTGSKGIGNI
jgi:hypothetical protein